MPTHLVIVESPAKARTIKRFLGKEYVVDASMGHVRDLPQSGLGVDIEKGFTPVYEVSSGKESVIASLRSALKKADELWIATDEDREGEAIGWHLTQALGIKDPSSVKRIVFHEITEEAIREAVANPRTLDMRLVDAQQARRILDRLVGYTLSPFLWKKVYTGLSAGRVQSVAVRIIVDREREIRAFDPQEYWSLDAVLRTDKDATFTAQIESKDGEKLALRTKEQTQEALQAVQGKPFTVDAVEEKEVTRNPAPPFTTSTLQQEASRKLGFSVKQTMALAQQLYEGVDVPGEGRVGLITYMRTDSVNLSSKALADAARMIDRLYGSRYVLEHPRGYKTKAKGAQEAHEAIRPTELERTPDALAGVLDDRQMKLYTLIWNRTVATQMPSAVFTRVAATIGVGQYGFRATGQTVLFDGFLRVYTEGRDDDETRLDAVGDGEKFLPPMQTGDVLQCDELLPEQHFTKPPARYTEASLVKKMEEEGIGRPSTYAPTISVIQQRGYIRKEGRSLIPEDVAFTVTDLLAEHFPDVVDLSFTASMEDSLDHIAEGKNDAASFLKGFFTPFQKLVEEKTKQVNKKDVLKEHVLGIDPASGKEVIVKMGRFGPYVQLGRFDPATAQPAGKKKKKEKSEDAPRTASLPKTVSMEQVSMEQAMALLAFPRVLGKEADEEVSVVLGRYGPYIKCGTKTVSLEKDMEPSTVTLEQAVQLLADAAEARKRAAEPLRDLGQNADGETVLVKDGRYGPYVTDGTTNASIPKKSSPEQITLEEAVELLRKKRENGPRTAWKSRKTTKKAPKKTSKKPSTRKRAA